MAIDIRKYCTEIDNVIYFNFFRLRKDKEKENNLMLREFKTKLSDRKFNGYPLNNKPENKSGKLL